MNEQARKGEGGGTARRVRSAKASGSRALLKRAIYRQGIKHSREAVERICRNWEHSLEERSALHGNPVVEERVKGNPFIRESAEIARIRLGIVAELDRLLDGAK